jgi:hypothetical protein
MMAVKMMQVRLLLRQRLRQAIIKSMPGLPVCRS